MGGLADVSRNEVTAAAVRAAGPTGAVDKNAMRAELLIEANRQLGAVHAQGLVDDLVGLKLGDRDLQAVIGELGSRLAPADASRVTQALDDANVNEGWFERGLEIAGGGLVSAGQSVVDGAQWLDKQASDGMAAANRYLDGVVANPDSSLLARGAALAGGAIVDQAQLAHGFSKGVAGQALGILGETVDLGKLAYQMSTDANYRNVVMGMAKAYAAEVAADPSKPLSDLQRAGQKALADWQAGYDKAKAEGREQEYLGRSGGAVALEVAATLVPVSKLAKFGKVAKLLDKITPDNLAALGRELGDLSRAALRSTGDAAAGAAQALKGIVGLARDKGHLADLVKAARASGNLDGLLKSGAFTPGELAHLQKTTPDVFNGKVDLNAALAASTKGVDVSKLSSAEVGAIGEALVTRDLVKKGYTDIVAIQNNSNHGIDLVARNKAGELEFFEIKASATGNAKPPQAGSQQFIQDRLQKALSAQGHWADQNMPAGVRRAAKDIADELLSSPPKATWVQVNLATDAAGKLDIANTRPNPQPWPR